MASEIDPCTRIILDFIRGGVPGNPSGEAKGNFNAYFGHTDSTIDLSKKTLMEIYAFQENMLLKDPRSTAIGGYQFIEGTLKSLVYREKLSGATLFTPEIQEKLATELLLDCGYPRWWHGELTDVDFLHALSTIWASLPDPQNNGKSHYDKLAVNHASTTLGACYTMLKSARAAIPADKPKPVVVEPEDDISKMEIVCVLPNGFTLYRQPNAENGCTYWSNEADGGACVWDTSLIDSATLLAAIVEEHREGYRIVHQREAKK